MTYALGFNIALGGSQTGITLNAQLRDETGSAVGSVISTGFIEIGSGQYFWYNSAMPDAFIGYVEFFEQGVPGTILASTSVNPQETELSDVKTSSRLANDDARLDNLDTALSDLATDVDMSSVLTYLDLMESILWGVTTGGTTDTITFKTPDGITTKIVVTVNPTTGDRTAVVIS